MIRSMSVPVCHRFHATRANSGTTRTFFRGGTTFHAFVRREPPLPRGTEFRHDKVLGAA